MLALLFALPRYVWAPAYGATLAYLWCTKRLCVGKKMSRYGRVQ